MVSKKDQFSVSKGLRKAIDQAQKMIAGPCKVIITDGKRIKREYPKIFKAGMFLVVVVPTGQPVVGAAYLLYLISNPKLVKKALRAISAENKDNKEA